MTSYLFAGGGTAGHVNPLLATADRVRERDPAAEIVVLGTLEGLESRLVPARGYDLVTVDRLPFPRRPGRAMIGFPQRFAAVVARIREIIVENGVDVVVGFGGYVSAPAYVAARRQGVPVVVHEANSRPGLANRLGSLFAAETAVAFGSARLRRATETGMPLRREIERLDRHAARPEAAGEFGLDRRTLTLVVTGGSLGARRINETMARAAPLVLGTGWQILHITGTRSTTVYPELPGYRVVPYCDRMDLALAHADLVVSRAGASTVSELSALAIPAVYVPLPVGNGEQRLNARTAHRAGAALVVDDGDFTVDWIADELLPLLQDRAALAAMAASASTIGIRDGADRLADIIDRVVGRAP
ncbi:MAG: hypothetical protein RI885_1511 [Actinomycetota bacterium]|jgi:UDP-N-acetylglucosamine--N-acetylmuramyl-(pentapeptide) pyrophosphoryl-undecaprenol N-acetylglucosamine transferase